MTPQEKAEELLLKYLRINNDTKEWFHKGLANQCALIAVDEIIKSIKSYDNTTQLGQAKVPYWEKVKQEIENL